MSYPSGRRFEWPVRNLLESCGWVTVRAARSKPVDLIALKDGRIPLIECNYSVHDAAHPCLTSLPKLTHYKVR
jgi:Holliday junction resolvase